MQQLSNKILEPIVQCLNDAVEQHRVWFGALMKSITCNLEHGSEDKCNNAHQLCGFGQWYYGEQPEFITNNTTFIEISTLHKSMHKHAAKILNNLDLGHSITPEDFDQFYLYLDDFVRAVEQLKVQIQELQFHRDSLTGAYNRTTLNKELNQMHDMVKREVSPACIVMMDLDFFKSFNDNYGHDFGDHVLKVTSDYILGHLRSFDKLFRYGGEEFLITLVNTDLDTAVSIAERMCAGIAELPLKYGENTAAITASFGIAVLNSDIEIEACVKQADEALYQAKNNGRNRVEFYLKH